MACLWKHPHAWVALTHITAGMIVSMAVSAASLLVKLTPDARGAPGIPKAARMRIKTMHLTNCWHCQSRGIATFYHELLQSAERLERPIMPRSHLLPHSTLRRILAEERLDLVECCDKYTLNYCWAAAIARRWWL